MKKNVNIVETIATTENRYNITDSGRSGKAFEIAFKQYANATRNKNGKQVSKQGETDLVKKIDGKRVKIELKTRCGELEHFDENGNITSSYLNNDYIIYTPNANAETLEIFVLTSENFKKALNACNLVKRNNKKSGGYKTNIQTFYNSRKRNNQWLNALNVYGETLEHFTANHIVNF